MDSQSAVLNSGSDPAHAGRIAHLRFGSTMINNMDNQSETAKSLLANSSISCILRTHCRERLFVPPLLWTNRQLDLLDSRFEDDEDVAQLANAESDPVSPLDISNLPAALPSTGSRERDQKDNNETQLIPPASAQPLVREVVDLALINELNTKRACITRLLGCLFKRSGKSLSFRFATRPIAKLPCFVFYHHQTGSRTDRHTTSAVPSQPPPYLAYLDLGDIYDRRHKFLQPPINLHDRYNEPVRRLYRLKMSSLTPVDRCYDPYIAAILISIAQRQRSLAAKAQALSQGNIFTPRCLLTDWLDNDYIHLYTTEVSHSFLDRLDLPAHVPACASSLVIRHTRIPFKPYDTFRNRLCAAIVSAPADGMKRKRIADGDGDLGVRYKSRRRLA